MGDLNIVEGGCATLGTNNITFCGITKTWETQQWVGNEEDAYERFVEAPYGVATIIYGISFLFCGYMARQSYRIFVSKIDYIPEDMDFLGFSQKVFRKLTNKQYALKRSFILFWFVKPGFFMLYDQADVCFDFHYFYRLELMTDDLLDNRIMRNTYVNNAIFAFAALGVLKSIIIGFLNAFVSNESRELFKKLTDLPNENKKIIEDFKEETFMINSATISLTALIFEDGAELFLEYFYVDKYATKKDWLVKKNLKLET